MEIVQNLATELVGRTVRVTDGDVECMNTGKADYDAVKKAPDAKMKHLLLERLAKRHRIIVEFQVNPTETGGSKSVKSINDNGRSAERNLGLCRIHFSPCKFLHCGKEEIATGWKMTLEEI